MGAIYKITSPSGKAYVGKTELTLEQRISIHAGNNSKCPAIKAAFQKYGKAAMVIEKLAEAPSDQLNKLEIAMIKEHQTFGPNGYNLTHGGDNPPLMTPEVAARIRETMARPEVKAKLSAAQKRNHAKPGAKQKRSEALKKAHANQETKDRYKTAWKIAQNREDVKEKQRVAQRKAHKDSSIHTARMAGLEAMRKDPKKEQARIEAIRAAHRRDPGINKRRSQTLKATLAAKRAKNVPQQRHDDLCNNMGVDMDVSDVRDDFGYSNEFEEAYLKSDRGRSRRLPAGMYDPGSPSVTYSIPGEYGLIPSVQ